MTQEHLNKSEFQDYEENGDVIPLVKVQTSKPFKGIVMMICISLLIGSAQGVCYSTTFQGSQCRICFSNSDIFQSCRIISKIGVSEESCRNTCCSLSYSPSLPSTCFDDQTQESGTMNLGTILVIIFFAIPVVICILALIHSCATRNSRQTPAIIRVRAESAQASAVNLADFSMDDQFPYLIDINDNCSICLENNCNIVTLCGHLYHSLCFAAWIRKKSKCPLCVTRNFNPVTVYCSKCFKATKMTILNRRLSSEATQAWVGNCDCKCQQCEKPEEDEESFNMNEEDIEKYNDWKRPDISCSQKSNKPIVQGISSIDKIEPDE